MKHFYIIVNEGKLDAVDMKLDIVEYLESRGATCKASSGEFSKGCPFTCVDDVPPETECVITLGGDGTLIRAARDLAGSGLPIIGINMGTLGYLTQMGREGDPKELLDALLEDRYEIHERMMLRGRVFHNDECIAEDIALNDIVLTREGELRVLKFELYVDGQFLNEYSADGMIVATPTGSTAYNLSAGGPIAQPDGELIILTPVCPHTLTSRTIVLGPNSKVRIRIPMKSQGYRMVSFDGDTQVNLDRGDYYEIEKADMVTRVVKLDSRSFLDILKHKMYEA
ncbi:MAG: NAD(+)/NADH kinase [Lachnoclostridium sp.]|nr:NAD(+)/NADH kinase [Lachnoclostridium sp.]